MERVSPFVDLTAVAILEAGALEDGIGFGVGMLRPALLGCRSCLRFSLLSRPFGRQCAFAVGEVVEASAIVVEPKEELQVLGGVLDVLEVVHEVTDSAWLCMRVSVVGESSPEAQRRTGQVPLLMMLSKDKASGMPAVLAELLEEYDSGFASPLREAADELTCAGRR